MDNLQSITIISLKNSSYKMTASQIKAVEKIENILIDDLKVTLTNVIVIDAEAHNDVILKYAGVLENGGRCNMIFRFGRRGKIMLQHEYLKTSTTKETIDKLNYIKDNGVIEAVNSSDAEPVGNHKVNKQNLLYQLKQIKEKIDVSEKSIIKEGFKHVPHINNITWNSLSDMQRSGLERINVHYKQLLQRDKDIQLMYKHKKNKDNAARIIKLELTQDLTNQLIKDIFEDVIKSEMEIMLLINNSLSELVKLYKHDKKILDIISNHIFKIATYSQMLYNDVNKHEIDIINLLNLLSFNINKKDKVIIMLDQLIINEGAKINGL